MVTTIEAPPVTPAEALNAPLIAPEVTAQAEAPPAPAASEPAAPASLDPAALEAWLDKADVKDLAKVPAWNKQVQREQARIQRDVEAKARAATEETTLVEQWRTWFDQLDEAQLRQALANEDYRRAYDKVQTHQARQSPVAQKIASEIVTGLQQKLSTQEEFKDLPWDELLASNDPAEFIHNVIERGLEKERKKMQSDLVKEIDARLTEALAKRNLAVPEAPDVPAAEFTPAGGGDGSSFDPRNQAQLDRAIRELGFDPRRM